MNLKKDNRRFLYIFTAFILLLIIISYIYINKKEQSLIDENYTKLANDIKVNITSLIDNKKNSTAAIVLPILDSEKLKYALKNRDFKELDYDKLKLKLRENTNYKNLWIEILDENFVSLYRSWTKNMQFKDFKSGYLQPFDEVIKSIEVTWYGLTFKAIAPIYDKKEKLGYIKTITKFNSIAKSIENQGFKPIVVVDKKYKKNIKNAFTNIFVEDYYIANLGASKEILEKLNQNTITNLKRIENYTIYKNYFVTKQKINNDMGYIFVFKKIDEIDISLINNFKKQAFLLVFILLSSLIFIVSIYTYNSYTRNIKKLNTNLLSIVKRLRRQRNKTQLLLDSQSSIIIITDGEEIVNANKQLLKFFIDCKGLFEFRQKYRCVCTSFIDMNDENYLIDIDYDGRNWAEHVMANPQKSFKAAIYDENKDLVHFKVSVATNSFDSYIIATLVDITYEIKLQNEAKQKDKLIFQQSKRASIVQVLHNIAHHWRQPLNLITTVSSSMKLYNQMKKLDDDKLNSNCDLILEKANYLSKTIDDFRDFFLINSKLESKNIGDIIKQTVKYLDSIIEDYNVDFKLKIDEDIYKDIYENEFKEALLKILNNSIELLYQRKDKDERVVIIKLSNNILSIKDSANGVDENSLDKLFEPYYTTKHESQGVGLSLYSVQKILTEQMSFEITARNSTFEYNNKKQKGLEIVIEF